MNVTSLKRCLLTAVFTISLIIIQVSTSFASNIKIDAVYLAQTHVSEPDYKYFNLTANRPALLKVNVVSKFPIRSPKVIATIANKNGKRRDVVLKGPKNLPLESELSSELGKVKHSYKDSFNIIIPKELIQPGLSIAIKAGNQIYKKDIKVGAPNEMSMQMFDIHYFGRKINKDYKDGIFNEVESKWPVSSFDIERVRGVKFHELVVPARPGAKTPHVRVSSPEEYKKKTGKRFDGEQAAALQWVHALSDSGGNHDFAMMYVNIIGVHSGGQAGAFDGVGQVGHHGIFHHELGHALGLPHWQQNKQYPYRGHMFGIQSPSTDKVEGKDRVHVGPIWGYDLRSKKFIPPTTQSNFTNEHKYKSEDVVGKYKRDPMAGGGMGDQEEGFSLRHFSDYSVYKMQEYIEKKLVVVKNDGKYYKWSRKENSYSVPDTGKVGVRHPIKTDVQVISVMAATTLSDKSVNMVYPPIGPYKGNLIYRFDPTVAYNRREANNLQFCPKDGCDFTLKVVQGGRIKHYMLAASGQEGGDSYKKHTLKTKAVNLSASDGPVTEVTLLHTPDVNKNGIKPRAEILYKWKG